MSVFTDARQARRIASPATITTLGQTLPLSRLLQTYSFRETQTLVNGPAESRLTMDDR